MNPSSIKMLELGTITMGDNPRLPTNLDIPALAENIGMVGLLEPIHVWYPNGNGIAEVIRGHRRTMALHELSGTNPKRYSELFKEGIPAIAWEGINADEALILKLDHGGQVSLSDPHELQMSATLMFNQGFTEHQVANQLKPLITKLSPMPPKARQEVKELEEKLEAARKAGDVNAIEVAEKAVEERIAKLYRGRVQHLHNVARCPHIVNAALYYKACGLKPKGFENDPLPKLTTDQVKALWKAHKADLEQIDENTGAPMYNKGRVGPLFTEKWNGILQKEAEADDDDKPARDKAMSGKDMKSEITEGKWVSVGFYKLTKRHTGDKTVEGLDALDKEYKALDLVKQYKSSLFEKVIAEGSKIEARLKEEAKANAEADKSEATEENAS